MRWPTPSIVLNGSNSSIVIPGLVNKQFSIPGKSVGIWPITGTANVNNLVSTKVSLGYANGGLEINVQLRGQRSRPAHQLDPARRRRQEPLGHDRPALSYNSTYQYFLIGQAHVQVHGNWSLNGPLSILNGLLPDINAKISSGLTQAITPELNLLSYELTSGVHSHLTGGRIASAVIGTDQMTLNVETPAPIF